MHCHQSIWKGEKNIFAGDSTRVCRRRRSTTSASHQARAGSSGYHQPRAQQLSPPGAGFEAPVNLAYSSRNRSAAIRVPVAASAKAKRIEFPLPGPDDQPLLGFCRYADGWCRRRRKQDQARQPAGQDIYALSPEEMKDVPKRPARSIKLSRHSRRTTPSCSRATFHQGRHRHLDRLERGKRDQAVAPAPDQLEFALYFDANACAR